MGCRALSPDAGALLVAPPGEIRRGAFLDDLANVLAMMPAPARGISSMTWDLARRGDPADATAAVHLECDASADATSLATRLSICGERSPLF